MSGSVRSAAILETSLLRSEVSKNPQFLAASVFYHWVIQLLALYSNLAGKKCLTIIGTEGPAWPLLKWPPTSEASTTRFEKESEINDSRMKD